MSEKNGKKNRHHPERGNSALKFFDRYIGIPLIFVLGLLKRRKVRRKGQAVRNAAFLQTAAIGDTVLSSALVQDFKRAYPDTRVTLFTGASNYETACLIPGIDDVIKLPVKNPLAALQLIRNAGPFDLWFDCGPWPRLNAIFTYFAPAGITIGFETERQYRHYAYDIVVRHSSSNHEIENYRRLLQGIGISDTTSMPALAVDRLPDNNKRIVIHMFPGGSRSYLKEWPDDRWIELINRLVQDGSEVVLTGTSANREKAYAIREQAREKEHVRVVAGDLSLRETAELLKSSRLVISVDTGIMHIASALGCDLVSLHGPTEPKRWGPLHNSALPLYPASDCSPCISLGFESRCKDPECMVQISVHDVIAAARELLKQ